MKYLLLLIPLSLFVAVGGAELYSRYKREKNYSALNTRWLEPYLGFGNFKDSDPASPASLAGYESKGLIYQWKPTAEVQSVLSRAPLTFGKGYPATEEKDPSRKRVVVVGGAVALGDGSWPKRFPGLLQEELRKVSRDLQVFTAATRSFVSTQERVALELYVFPLRPDAIVFLHGFNDMNQAASLARPGDPYNMGVNYARSENPWFGFLQLLAEHSALVERFLSRSVLATFADGRDGLTKTARGIFSRSAAAVYEDNVRWMARRCEQEKVRCLFLLQPFRDFEGEYGEESVRMAYRLIAAAFQKNPLKGMASFHDLALPYSKRPELFNDEVHMGEAGQTAVAKDAAALLKMR
jgi:hypothetical protein